MDPPPRHQDWHADNHTESLFRQLKIDPKKLNFSQSSFLNCPTVSTSVPTWACTTETCQSSLIYSSTFSVVQLQQQKPLWVQATCTCRGSLLVYRRLCQLSYQQQTRSAIARAWITVTGYNFPTACGTPAAGQHAVIQHPPTARTNIFFFLSPKWKSTGSSDATGKRGWKQALF